MNNTLDIDPLHAGCRQEEAVARQQIHLLESDRIGTYEKKDDGSTLDTTARTLAELHAKLEALESMLASAEKPDEPPESMDSLLANLTAGAVGYIGRRNGATLVWQVARSSLRSPNSARP
jgi:hypothetical protein